MILSTVGTVVLAIVRSRPADIGLLPDGEAAASAGHTGTNTGADLAATIKLRQAVRAGAFWTLASCFFLWAFASLSILAHLVAHLRDVGFASGTAAAALGLTVGASVAGRVVVGYFSDSASKRDIMSAALAFSGLSTMLLFSIRPDGVLPLFVITYGFALGGIAVLLPLLVGECFGLFDYSKILSLVMIAATLGAAAGPVLTGRVHDVTGSYRPAFMLHVAAFLAAAVAIRFLPRPPASAAQS
jgi:MFS family permease